MVWEGTGDDDVPIDGLRARKSRYFHDCAAHVPHVVPVNSYVTMDAIYSHLEMLT